MLIMRFYLKQKKRLAITRVTVPKFGGRVTLIVVPFINITHIPNEGAKPLSDLLGDMHANGKSLDELADITVIRAEERSRAETRMANRLTNLGDCNRSWKTQCDGLRTNNRLLTSRVKELTTTVEVLASLKEG